MTTPKEDGFYFPAEWHSHEATWLSFPHNKETWGAKLSYIYPSYFLFIKHISESERVNILINDAPTLSHISKSLLEYGISKKNVFLYQIKNNDAWCRDHGPSFVINPSTNKKAIVNWEYNAWGGKYPPYEDDNKVPGIVAKKLGLNIYNPKIVMEGGAIDLNGNGTLITSKSCLLNKNRNPHLNQKSIEKYLIDYYNIEKVLWLEEGIAGDDTDGHIDDMTRFVNRNTVINVIENNRLDVNFEILKKNQRILQKMSLPNKEKLNIIQIPMPTPILEKGIRLPASYANFYICNEKVIVPTFSCKQDDIALKIIEDSFKNRKVVGIDARNIIWGLGSFHCLSQQEPSTIAV